MKRVVPILIAMIAVLAQEAALAVADEVTLAGTTIPLRDCTVQAVKGGRVFFTDAHGRRYHEPISNIRSIGFDALPRLAEAEALVSQNQLDSGIKRLAEALLDARDDSQRLWIHARLALAHRAQGEYVQAAGHAAAVFTLDPDPGWKSLAPIGVVNSPTFPAAKEAHDFLKQAERTVRSTQLARDVETMLRAVEPVYERLAKTYDGPALAEGSTVSGYLKTDLRRNAQQRELQLDIAEAEAAQRAEDAQRRSEDSLESVQALLNNGASSEALAMCERLSQSAHGIALDELLYLHGRALRINSRSEDAVVLFMQCALQFPTSPRAAACLLDAAEIHIAAFRDPVAARRLAARAIEVATPSGQNDVVERAQRLLNSLHG